MRCAKSYQDIESPDEYKDNSDYYEEMLEKYVEKWGEQTDEDYDIIHLYWYTLVSDYLDESILDTSVNEMRESLVWHFKRSSEDRLKDIWVLQEQVRKMKCCSNCKHFNNKDDIEYCWNCERQLVNSLDNLSREEIIKDEWEIKEK